MKTNKTTKIIVSSLLATVLVGAGAVKLSNDSNSMSEYAIERKENHEGQKGKETRTGAFEGGSVNLQQTAEENNAALDTWYEYTSNPLSNLYSPPGYHEPPIDGDDTEIGVNFSVVNLDEPETFNGVTYDQYYAIGIVFNQENAKNPVQVERQTDIWSGKGITGDGAGRLEPVTIQLHNKYWYDAPVDGSNSQTRSPGDLNAIEDEGAEFTWNSDVGMKSTGANNAPGSAPTPTVSIPDPENPGHYIDDNNDGYYGPGGKFFAYSTLTNADSHDVWELYGPTSTDIIEIRTDAVGSIPEEEWHEMFDNDETTLFGASSYRPESHFILKLPVTDWVDGEWGAGDPVPDDNFGLTPIGDLYSDNVNRDTGQKKKYRMKARALSNKDALSLASFGFKSDPSNNTIAPYYGITFDSGVTEYSSDPDSLGRQEIVFSYPTPKFEMTTLGYNEKNEFEVLFEYDHTPTSKDFSIVNYIDYSLTGPLTDAVDAPKIALDHIYVDDQGAHREIVRYLDPSDDPSKWDGDETFIGDSRLNEYTLTSSQLADQFPQWTDGSSTNGGEVGLDETPDSNVYRTGFDLPDYDQDGSPDSEYKGDMEIGTEKPIQNTLKYTNLFYDKSELTENPVAINYDFNATASITPTTLGANNAFLVEANAAKTPQLISYDKTVTIKANSAAPIIEKFEVVGKDITDFDISTPTSVHVEGDSKTLDEDVGTGQLPTGNIKLGVVYTKLAYDVDGNPIYPEEPSFIIDGETAAASKEDSLISDMVEVSVDANGKFSTDIEIPANSIAPNGDYTLSLFTQYGSAIQYGENQFVAINEDGIDVNVGSAGTMLISMDTFNVVWSDPDTEADNSSLFSDDGTATITFNTSTALPAGAEWPEDSYEDPEVTSVKVMNGENVIKSIDAAAIDAASLIGSQTITVSETDLAPNRTYDLSVVIETADGQKVESSKGATFQTQSLGEFTPTVGSLTTVDQVDNAGHATSNFKFNFDHQATDGLNVSDYIASGVTGIDFVMNDVDGTTPIIQRTITPAELVDGSQEIKIYGTDTGLEGGTAIEFDPSSSTPYSYTITANWAGEPVVKEGAISFAFKGNDEMLQEDVTVDATAGIQSTATTANFSLNFNDVAQTAGYDSYNVLNVSFKDEAGNTYDGINNSEFQIKDSTGAVVENIPDRAQGELLNFGMDVFLYNLKPGTDFTKWTIEIETDSSNSDGAEFETDYSFNLGEIMGETPITNPDGSDVVVTNPTSVSMVEGEEGYLITEAKEEQASVLVNFNDVNGHLANNMSTIVLTQGGVDYSLAEGNLAIENKTEAPAREAGVTTILFTLIGLTAETTYDNFSMTYMLNETVINPFDGGEQVSMSLETANIDELVIVTADKPITPDKPIPPKEDKHFPWWIIILLLLLLITAGLILFVLWWLKQPKVVSTTETAKGTATFSINRDGESGFDKLIKGRTLNATQDGNELSAIEWTSTLGQANEVLVTLTGIKNTAAISKLVFVADEAANEKAMTKYEADLAKWEEAKEAAKEADKEFNKEKPVKPEISKDIKVGGSVDTEILKEYTGGALKNEAQVEAAIKSTNREIKNQKIVIKQADKTIKSSTASQTKKNTAQKAKDAAEVKLEEANKNLELAKAAAKEIKAKGTATVKKLD